jgi:hypothetical protein
MREKWTPHIIAVNALVVFIVLGLACASAPEGTVAQENRQEIRQEVQQYDSEKDFEFDWDENVSGGIVITEYIGSKKEVRIPPSIQNNPVTGIGGFGVFGFRGGIGGGRVYRAFSFNKSLTSVTIPNSVIRIEQQAFDGCTSLTSIIIPDSVTSIKNWAFQDCTSLTSVTIPNSVTSIGEGAFENCQSLTSITIPDSVTSIGGSAFKNTVWLNNQPNGVVYAGKVAYTYKGTMPANTSITLLDGTKGIAGNAFTYCKNLTKVTIPNSVTSIGREAFANCTSLTSITIPNSVTSIGAGAFAGCFNLTSVTFQGTIAMKNEWQFDGDLPEKYLARGPGTYTTKSINNSSSISARATWTKQ